MISVAELPGHHRIKAMISAAELPDNVICHIISLASLTNKEAIQRSLLSKDLFWALRKRPALRFAGGNKKELDSVHETLIRYHADGIPLDTFTFKTMPAWPDLQTECISLAAKKRLRHLDLHGIIQRFPESVFEVESLENLRINDTYFYPRVSIAWPNLKRLCLINVDMEIRHFQNIILGSPLIQSLEIIRCFNWRVNKFEVTDLRNLKKLRVELTGTQTFEIDVPGLESLTCTHPPRSTEIIDNIGLLYNFSPRNLKTLSLDCLGFSDNFFRNFGHQFRRLENLSISNNKVLKVLVISSSSLKNIRLENVPELDKAFFGVPNVVLFEYSGDSMPELSFSGNPCGWISRIKLGYTYKRMNQRWFLKLNEFLTTLNMSEISMTVEFHGLISENSDKISRHCILGMKKPKVRDFRIETFQGFSLSFVRAFAENIFLICEPQTVTYPPDYCDSVHEKKIRSSSTWFGFKFFTCLFPFS